MSYHERIEAIARRMSYLHLVARGVSEDHASKLVATDWQTWMKQAEFAYISVMPEIREASDEMTQSGADLIIDAQTEGTDPLYWAAETWRVMIDAAIEEIE